jgi:predicted RNA polymerase sigma factor
MPVAQASLERAARLIDNAEVHYALARVARDLGHDTEARKHLQRALALTNPPSLR